MELRRRVVVVGWSIVLAGVALLVVPQPAAADDQTVSMANNAYEPGTVTIEVGDTVTWVHEDGQNPHTVTADDGSFDSSPGCFPDCMEEGDTFARTFDAPGSVDYFCKVHGQAMSGTVVVQAAPTTTTTAASTTTAAPTTTTAAPTTSTTAVATTPAPGGATTTTTAAAAPAAGAGLARTGSPAALLSVTGLGLVAAGAAVLLGARRRREAGR